MMQDKPLQFWRIGPEDVELAERIKAGFNRLLDNPPGGYFFAFLDGTESLPPADNDVSFVAGESLERLLGYAKASETLQSQKLLQISLIETFVHGKGIGTMLLDYIKSEGYFQILAETGMPEAVRFFEHNGFRINGIDSKECWSIMEWEKK